MPTLETVANAAESTLTLPFTFCTNEKPDYIQENFEKFHAAHPDIYIELVEIARAEKAAGRQRWGMKAAYELLRSRRGRSFVLNNNYTAIYGRLIMEQENDLRGFFRLRERKL